MSTQFFLISASTITSYLIVNLASSPIALPPPLFFSATHFIASALDKHSSVCGIFLDLKKAFDSVPHKPLIDLLSSLNIPCFLVNWIHSYLSSRFQSVFINSSSSRASPVVSGVPQGSILGPLLFLLYFNQICLSPHPLNLLSMLMISSYSTPSTQPLTLSIQSDLNSIASTISSIYLSLNPDKSKYMIFSLKPQPPPICLTKLSWSLHINTCSKKARRLLGRHFYKSCFSKSLLTLYLSTVHPILEYGSIIWDPSSTSYSSALESIQFFALKIISKSWSSSYSTLLHLLKLNRLDTHSLQHKLLTAFKIHNNLLFLPDSPLILSPRSHYQLHSHSPHNFSPIPSNLSLLKNSYFQSIISFWNSLPMKSNPPNLYPNSSF